MKGIDLSKFKKVAEDKHSTTLAHPDGHEVRVAHFVLDHKTKKSMASMPIDTSVKRKFAKGGYVEADPDKAKAMASPNKPTQTDQAITQAVQHPIQTVKSALGFASGGDTDSGTPLVDPNSIGLNAQVPDTAATPAASSDSAIPIAPDEQPAIQVPNSPLATPPPAAAAPGGDWSASAGNMAQDASAVPDAQQAAPTAPPAMGAPAAPAPQQHSAPQAAQPQADPKQQEFQQLAQHHDFQHDLDNGHITPKTYSDLYENKSTLGKIGTIFGMMIGGLGAGLAHQPNMLMEMMNKEIGNDLEAQKASAANKQNWYKLNLEQQMNQAQQESMKHGNTLTDQQAASMKIDAASKAYALSRMQMNSAALHQLTQQVQALPMGSPQRNQAEQTLAMMSQAAQGENYNIADKAAGQAAFFKQMMGTGAQDPNNPEGAFQQRSNMLKMLGPQGVEKSKDLEAKHMPGLQGQASVPLTADDRTQLNAGMQFGKQAERFRDWAKQHSGSLNPSTINQGKALAAELQGAFRAASNGGVYKEGEQHFISKLIDSDPTKFFNSVRVLPQLDAIVKENTSKVDQMAKSKGFQGYSGQSSQQQQPQTKTVNGVTYMRGPNGEAIKVK